MLRQLPDQFHERDDWLRLNARYDPSELFHPISRLVVGREDHVPEVWVPPMRIHIRFCTGGEKVQQVLWPRTDDLQAREDASPGGREKIADADVKREVERVDGWMPREGEVEIRYGDGDAPGPDCQGCKRGYRERRKREGPIERHEIDVVKGERCKW